MAIKFEDIEVVGVAEKNMREKVQVKLVSVNDKPCLDFRVYYTKAGSDDLHPTGKGLCLNAECMTELLPLLEKGLKDLKKMVSD